jgi:hypothetical protein
MKKFLKSIAWNAHIDGKTATEFEAAAHRHGSAFWFYVIVTAIVWWFANWRWALIPEAIAVYTAWNAIAANFVGHYMKELERRIKDYNEKSQQQATILP